MLNEKYKSTIRLGEKPSTILLNRQEIIAFRNEATKRGISMSELVRRICREFLKENNIIIEKEKENV
jgi:hypothetical protein